MVPKQPRSETEGGTRTKQSLSPAVVHQFCALLGIPEKPAAKAIANCVRAAYRTWPAMIKDSGITGQQKKRLLDHFQSHSMIASLVECERARIEAGSQPANSADN